MEPARVIVINPGSCTLKIGLASDSSPHTIPHVIARRVVEKTEQKFNQAYLAPPPSIMGLKLSSLQAIKSTLSEIPKGPPTPTPQAYTENNCRIPLPEGTSYKWTNTSQNQPYFVGEEALNINPADPYEIHRPIKHGGLNVSASPSALRVVCNDLQTIWEYAVVNKLNIPAREIPNYCVCLVIPDLYDKRHVKEMIHILMVEMRFKAILLHQESVCATFGAGLTTACVVDIGHDRVNVSCVEEGVGLVNTRFSAWYGLDDVSKLLHWLLLKRDGTSPAHTYYFPYNECRMERPRDAEIINHIKETLCYLPPTEEPPVQNHKFTLRTPIKPPPATYNITLGPVLAIAPMGLFYPDAFAPLDNPPPPEPPAYDFENPWDEAYLMETTSGKPSKLESEVFMLDMVERRVPIPIDDMIAKSIGYVERPELKSKLFTTILLAGGGGVLEGLSHMLEDRLVEVLTGDVERVEVVTARRDPQLDSRNLSWRGGGIVSSLDNSKDMWILRNEWQFAGVSLLRERLPFPWA